MKASRKHRLITIDGPAGAGKSSVARKLADRLGFSYLDSGAIYRTLTLACLREGVDVKDEKEVLRVAEKIDMRFEVEQGKFVAYLGSENVSEEIRRKEVSEAVSFVARHPRVREMLLEFQTGFAEAHDAVCDGRDMGSRVFPDADVKIFLTASLEERARRRYREMRAKGLEVELEEVLENLQKRDAIDSGRDASPLVVPEGAIIIDTTDMSEDEVVEAVYQLVKERLG